MNRIIRYVGALLIASAICWIHFALNPLQTMWGSDPESAAWAYQAGIISGWLWCIIIRS